MRFAVCAALIAWAAAAPECLAANVNNPYGNVDHRNDAGNDTGDSQVDRLNEAQLSGAMQPGFRRPPSAYPGYAQPSYYSTPPYGYRPAPYGYASPGVYPPPGYAPPTGYRPQPGYPPQGYAPPGY